MLGPDFQPGDALLTRQVDYGIEWMGLEKQTENRDLDGILLGIWKRPRVNITKLIFVHGQGQGSIVEFQRLVSCFQNCDPYDAVFAELRVFRQSRFESRDIYRRRWALVVTVCWEPSRARFWLFSCSK